MIPRDLDVDPHDWGSLLSYADVSGLAYAGLDAVGTLSADLGLFKPIEYNDVQEIVDRVNQAALDVFEVLSESLPETFEPLQTGDKTIGIGHETPEEAQEELSRRGLQGFVKVYNGLYYAIVRGTDTAKSISADIDQSLADENETEFDDENSDDYPF